LSLKNPYKCSSFRRLREFTKYIIIYGRVKRIGGKDLGKSEKTLENVFDDLI